MSGNSIVRSQSTLWRAEKFICFGLFVCPNVCLSFYLPFCLFVCVFELTRGFFFLTDSFQLTQLLRFAYHFSLSLSLSCSLSHLPIARSSVPNFCLAPCFSICLTSQSRPAPIYWFLINQRLLCLSVRQSFLFSFWFLFVTIPVWILILSSFSHGLWKDSLMTHELMSFLILSAFNIVTFAIPI